MNFVPLSGKRPDGTLALSEVEPEQVRWLWPKRIPLGKLTIIDGHPGLGKSWITLHIAARLSRGEAMPDGTGGHLEPSTSLVLSYEDGCGDTIRPRCEALGAELTRIIVLDPKRAEHLDLDPEGLKRLEQLIVAHEVKLAILDPLMACLPRDRDAHKDQDVRAVLARLAAIAERRGCAVLIVRHLNKSKGSPAILRGGGSVGIAGQARAVHLVAKDPDDSDQRFFVPVKSNLAARPPAWRFRLAGDPTVVEWLGEADVDADKLVEDTGRKRDRPPIERAKAALEEVLADGPIPAAEARRLVAAASGASARTIDEARRQHEVRAFRAPGIKNGPWYWELASLRPSQEESPGGSSAPFREGRKDATEETYDSPLVLGDDELRRRLKTWTDQQIVAWAAFETEYRAQGLDKNEASRRAAIDVEEGVC